MPSGIWDLEVNSTANVIFGEGYGSEDFKLMEVDDAIVGEILDQEVTIRGCSGDEAVLCTSTSTYAIKFVATSNTVLLIPPPDHAAGYADDQSSNGSGDAGDPEKGGGSSTVSVSAIATSTGHLELVHTAPRLERLKELLSRRPYRDEGEGEGEDTMEEEDAEGLFTWDDLTDNVQASDKELLEGLKSLAAVQIGKHWRLVDEKFMRCLFEVIILNAVQHDWPLNALRSDEVLPVLNADGYSSRIVRHCLETYGARICSLSPAREDEQMGTDDDQREVWALDEKQVCLHYARQLLTAASKWRLDDFLEAWQRNLPTGITCNVELLRGEALVEKLGSESWLRPFSTASLSTKPAARFAALFKERPRWEWQDLEPYVRDLRAPGQSVEALLIRYTRKIQPTADASPIFAAR
eukprot:c47547_g1_i1 orf=301-1527(-)